VIKLSPRGFVDVRISPKLVPWTVVQGIFSWRDRNTRIILVKVAETVWQDPSISHLAHWSRSANASLGMDGLPIAAVELWVKFDDLLEMMTAYAATYSKMSD
jgi:hypothetical protein